MICTVFFLHYCIPKENQAERYIPSYYKTLLTDCTSV